MTEDRSDNGRFLRILLTAAVSALALLSLGIDSPWYMIAAAVVTLGLMSVSLFYISDRFFYFGNESKLLPLVYLLLVLSSPEALHFSSYHLLSLGLIWAMYFNVKFMEEEEDRFSSLFFTTLISMTITLFEPVMLWLILVLLLIDMLTLKGDWLRLSLIAFSAIALPVLYMAVALFVLDRDIPAYLESFRTALCTVNFSLDNYPMVSFFYMLVLLVHIVKSFLLVYREGAFVSSVSDRAIKRDFLILLLMGGVYVLYFLSTRSLSVFLLYVPMAFSIFYLYLNRIARTEVRVLSLLLVLAIVLQRVYYLIY